MCSLDMRHAWLEAEKPEEIDGFANLSGKMWQSEAKLGRREGKIPEEIDGFANPSGKSWQSEAKPGQSEANPGRREGRTPEEIREERITWKKNDWTYSSCSEAWLLPGRRQKR